MKPTVGRIVHYHDPANAPGKTEPLAAVIVQVHSPSMVNLTVFEQDGRARGETSVDLLPVNEVQGVDRRCCTWPPRA